MKANLLTKTVISEARDLLENFDESGAMTIGFDKPKYTITSEQLQLLAQAIYLADCLIYDIEENENR